jgi:hypothetical protein
MLCVWEEGEGSRMTMKRIKELSSVSGYYCFHYMAGVFYYQNYDQ